MLFGNMIFGDDYGNISIVDNDMLTMYALDGTRQLNEQVRVLKDEALNNQR